METVPERVSAQMEATVGQNTSCLGAGNELKCNPRQAPGWDLLKVADQIFRDHIKKCPTGIPIRLTLMLEALPIAAEKDP